MCQRKILLCLERCFVRQFQELYGLRNMSFNVHCLIHLPDVVLLIGPLWVASCFGFENLNGQLCRLVHGTRFAGLQIQSNLGLLRNMTSVINTIHNKTVKAFCMNAMSHGRRLLILHFSSG